MRSHLRRAGAGLAAVSLATAGAYFVALMSDGHRTPLWPFGLLLGLTVVGVLAYFVGQSPSGAGVDPERLPDGPHEEVAVARLAVNAPTAPVAEPAAAD